MTLGGGGNAPYPLRLFRVITLLSLLQMAQPAKRARIIMGETPLLKRGPRAWSNYDPSSASRLGGGGWTRLLTHSIADATATQWIPKVKEFLQSCKQRGLTFSSVEEVDMALADCFDHMCYAERRGASFGTVLLFGLLCLAPEWSGSLPLARRSLRSWRKLMTSMEGGPIAEEAVFCIAEHMFEHGHIHEGCWVLIQYDTYGREQDMDQLRGEDVHVDDRSVALVFGEASRGESVKTGIYQGVVIGRGPVADLARGLKMLSGGEKLMPVNINKFRKLWHSTCSSLKLDHTGPLHTLRHAGPSEDISRDRIGLEGARRRGRWKSMDSVQRYSKTFAVTKYRSRMPAALITRGHRFGENLRSSLLRVLSSKKARKHLATATLVKQLKKAAFTNQPLMKDFSSSSATAAAEELSSDEGWTTE